MRWLHLVDQREAGGAVEAAVGPHELVALVDADAAVTDVAQRDWAGLALDGPVPRLGFGHIVVSEIRAPNMSINLV